MQASKQVRQERTGWRDAAISAKHREWGWDAPMVDIDWLVCEFDHARPAAIVEYKEDHAKPVDLGSHSMRALRSLADSARIGFFIVRYSEWPTWHFLVQSANEIGWRSLQAYCIAINPRARAWQPREEHRRVIMDEADYVQFMYRIRGRRSPEASA